MRAARALCVLVLLTTCACTMNRTYIGAPLAVDPDGRIVVGQTTRAEVLDVFGAPNRIFRHGSGDVFVYQYTRRNEDTLSIEDPVITNFQIFTYTRVEEREDRLVVLFDAQGRVESVGRFDSTQDLD